VTRKEAQEYLSKLEYTDKSPGSPLWRLAADLYVSMSNDRTAYNNEIICERAVTSAVAFFRMFYDQ
jgi:hypothetical protein